MAQGAECRASAGPCDVAEACTGSASQCPVDDFKSAATECRAAAGPCDLAEACTGASASCPSDGLKPSSTECRAAVGACDAPETCTGVDTTCPSDVKKAAGAVCRASSGACDIEEVCAGNSDGCPADGVRNGSTLCRPAAGDCDAPEVCSGEGVACPPDVLRTNATVCRPAAGVCDQAETCTGVDLACPADLKRASSALCRAAAGVCDADELCAGGNDCPTDLKLMGTVCRAAANGGCDVAETCPGNSNACPSDAFAQATTVCRPSSTGACDPAEQCTGNSALCPTNVSQPPANCEPYACLSATGCRTSCTTDADCGPNFRSVCASGACVTAKLVFVSSTTSATANLGGLTGADTTCQTLANAAALGGTFKAWMSSASTSAAARLTQATVPYILRLNKTKVANNWAGLTGGGNLLARIDADEFGVRVPGTNTLSWTGTNAAGGNSGLNCSGFTVATPAALGGYGILGTVGSGWTYTTNGSCSTAGGHIICFEQ